MNNINNDNIKVPEGWKRVSLGEVIDRIGDGGTPSRTDMGNFGGDIPWVVIEDIKKRIYDTKEKLTLKGLKNSNAKLWEKGSIILSFGATIGEVGIAEVDLATKQGIAGLELKSDQVYNLFLYFSLLIKKNELLKLANQTTILEVRPTTFVDKLYFLLPPLPEQQKIAEILETVDRAIEKTDKIIEKYKRIKQGLMQDLLTKGIDKNGKIRSEKTHKFKNSPLGRIPEEWEVVRAEEVFYLITDYVANGSFATLKKNVVYSEIEDYAILIRLIDFNNDFKGPFIYVNKSAYDFLIKTKLVPEDIIISNVGAYAGLVFKVKNINKPMTLGPNAILVRTNQIRDFIYYWLKSNIGQNCIQLIISITAQPKFNKTDFRKLLIPLPPLPEQQRIAEILSQIDNTIEKEEAYKQKLERIKKGLMEDLFTGRVRVNKLIKEVKNEK